MGCFLKEAFRGCGVEGVFGELGAGLQGQEVRMARNQRVLWCEGLGSIFGHLPVFNPQNLRRNLFGMGSPRKFNSGWYGILWGLQCLRFSVLSFPVE